MAENRATPAKLRPGKLRITHLLRPHWRTLSFAFLAVLGETLTDVLEPWPIKVVVDNLPQHKNLPGWIGRTVSSVFGQNQVAILNFAVASVAAIAVVGALSSHLDDRVKDTVKKVVKKAIKQAVKEAVKRNKKA